MGVENYLFVIETFHPKPKLSIKNKKYYKHNKTAYIMDYKYFKEFYKYKDLQILNSFIFEEFYKNEKTLFNYQEFKRLASEIPLWVLKFKNIYDLIEDNLYLQLAKNASLIKANKSRLKLYLKFEPGKIESNIDAKIQKIFLYLGKRENIIDSLQKNKNFKIFVSSILYKGNEHSNAFIFQKDYTFSTEFEKVLKINNQEIEKLKSFFILNHDKDSLYNPIEISKENLFKLFKKYKESLDVSFTPLQRKHIKILDKETLNEKIKARSFSRDFLEKIMFSLDKGYVEHNGNLYLLENNIDSEIENLFDEYLNNDLKEYLQKIKKLNEYKKEDPELYKLLEKDNGFLAQLFDHQKVSLNFLYNAFIHDIKGVLIADEMGGGKTLSVISFLYLIYLKKKKKLNILIVAPASVVGSWERQINKFAPKLFQFHDIKIMSYEKVLRSNIDKVDILILDEAQKIKNNKTEIFKKLDSIQRNFSIIITGTPIENKVDDLINIISIINPHFQSLKQYKRLSRNFVMKLREIIDPLMLRRKKEDLNIQELDIALNEIPLFIQPTDFEIKLINEIRRIYRDQLLKLKATSNLEFYESQIILTGLMRIRQALSYPAQLPEDLKKHLPHELKIKINSFIPSKFKKLKEELKKIQAKKERSVIFCEFTETINFLKNKLSKDYKILTLTGSDTTTKRKIIIEEFQRGKYDLIIISLKAGNSGITLTAANNTFIYDLWFNPQVLAQAIARVHRIGQTKDVNAYYLIIKNTFDEKIYKILEKKKKLVRDFDSAGGSINVNKIATKLGEEYFKNFKVTRF